MELLGEWVMWNLISIRLEIVLVLVQDRCTVCAKHTTGSEIILDAPGGTLGDQAKLEYLVSVRFDIGLILTQDRCVVCTECTIRS